MNIKIPKLALKRRETRLLNFKIEKNQIGAWMELMPLDIKGAKDGKDDLPGKFNYN